MPDLVLLSTEEKMEKAVEALKREMSKIRTGRANPGILEAVRVDYYGMPTPVNQMAGVSVPEAQQLLIKPFDKSTLKDIERAIVEANLGINPQNDGESIRLTFPALTEQRRRDLGKEVKSMGENSKVAVRNVRRDGIDALKKAELPEDELKGYEEEIQKLTDKYNKIIDETVKNKEDDLMKI